MKCPTCREVDLVISDRQGVEIDYCPNCRGVWLDRGELDKIIERSAAMMAPPTERYDDDHYDDRRDRDRPRRDPIPKKKKRESFLSELFDF
jgi:Zn-finger nucleic acid-binding protein